MSKKKKGSLVIGILLTILIITGIGIYIYSHFEILHIPRSLFCDFSYTVYPDYVELEKYYGNSKVVKIPKQLWGRPVTVIGAECFTAREYWEDNEKLQKVVMNPNIEVIGNMAFSRCVNLSEIIGGENVRKIGEDAFVSCENLKDIGQLGERVECIESTAFAGCKNLTYFPFTENLKQVKWAAFSGSGIEKVDSAINLTYLEADVFEGTPWLLKHTEEFITYNNILICYQGKESKIKIPNGIKGIAIHFRDIEGIEEIYVPSSVEYINSGCLMSCEEIRIYIPKEVEKIGYKVLDDGTGCLKSIDGLEETSGNVIVTTAGSPAEAYAKEFGFECEIVEGW